MTRSKIMPCCALAILALWAIDALAQTPYVRVHEYRLAFPISHWRSDVTVINMMPNAQSNETSQDSEPNIAVNPTNVSRIIGSAFTPNPTGSTTTAPIYMSTDGGDTWTLNNIVPSGNGMTGDISIKFGTRGSTLYAGILLGGSGLTMNILRSSNPFGATTMTQLVSRANVDQPYVNAITTSGLWVLPVDLVGRIELIDPTLFRAIYWFDRDRVFVGNNDFGPAPQTATVDHSASARTAAAPAGLSSTVVESRTPSGQDRPSVRCSSHSDGTVYALFATTTASSGTNRTCNVVVVRDDNFAMGTSPFTALADTDGNSGIRVATGVNMPFINAPALGQNRLGSHMSICVNPQDSDEVYIAWTDRPGTTGTSLHVRRSNDRGATWSADVLTVTDAINPALAVNSIDVVAVLYQRLTGSAPNQTWETHLQRSSNNGSSWSDMTLAEFQDNNPAPAFQPYLGDYCDLMSVGEDFYGTFSSSNLPDMNNFPQGVTYQRNANFTSNVLRNVGDTANVNVSIDPFFFHVEYRLVNRICELCPQCCGIAVIEPGLIRLRCEPGEFCEIRDPIPDNCLVKYDCPGCEGTALCPPYFHIYLDDFDPDIWIVDLRTGSDRPVNYELNATRTGVVLSFRPSREQFEEQTIGDFELVFEATEQVEAGMEYEFETRLEVSDYRFREHTLYAARKAPIFK